MYIFVTNVLQKLASPCLKVLKILISYLPGALTMTEEEPPQVLHEKSVLKNFSKPTERNLCQSLYINKITGLKPATSLQTLTQLFALHKICERILVFTDLYSPV